MNDSTLVNRAAAYHFTDVMKESIIDVREVAVICKVLLLCHRSEVGDEVNQLTSLSETQGHRLHS